eukprot:TRINITY_DN4169_c0_g1_i2.p2 TRINITY_DN4169_c0_g1~~TRINITY_DN4169_c0_g1_i2.p2  ORF type:complete len:449 (+),score=191.40 TRINITY_DN4169_c0_g1_i2:191-1348(+)
MYDANGKEQDYDIYLQTQATIQNLKDTLKGSGVEWTDVIDVQCFLVNMQRDFKGFNKAYREGFEGIRPTRTTVSVKALPAPVGVNIKIIARAPMSPTPLRSVEAKGAPAPVGAYPHAIRYGDLLFISGLGPRDPKTNGVPGGNIQDPNYDAGIQTTAVINNIKTVIEACGARFCDILDCMCFLINMDRDYEKFNEAYTHAMGGVQATRTTVAIRNLPTPIAVELKVIVRAPDAPKNIPQAATVVRQLRSPNVATGRYPHTRRFGDHLFVSGVGARDPLTNKIPGGAIRDAHGKPQEYDVFRQTQGALRNLETVLKTSGCSFRNVVDIQVFLVNVERDFDAFNEAYTLAFGNFMPARTVMAVLANVTQGSAVVFKCLVQMPPASKY